MDAQPFKTFIQFQLGQEKLILLMTYLVYVLLTDRLIPREARNALLLVLSKRTQKMSASIT